MSVSYLSGTLPTVDEVRLSDVCGRLGISYWSVTALLLHIPLLPPTASMPQVLEMAMRLHSAGSPPKSTLSDTLTYTSWFVLTSLSACSYQLTAMLILGILECPLTSKSISSPCSWRLARPPDELLASISRSSQTSPVGGEAARVNEEVDM